MSKYDEMSVKKLETELTRLTAAQKKLKTEKQAVAAALDAQLVRANADARIAALSDPERAALAQAIEAMGISSGGGVGTPGTE